VSLTEILVVIGGLALGYWAVTWLINDLNRDRKNPLGKNAPPPEPPEATGDQSSDAGTRKK
jgi:hypothetical protein